MIFGALWVMLCAGTGVAAVPDPPSMQVVVPDFGLNTKDYRFPSGLRILVQRDDAAPVVSITTVIGHGSAEDPPGSEGMSLLVERLWAASGTPSRRRVISDIGGQATSLTSLDGTRFQVVAPKGALPALLKLESDRLTTPIAEMEIEVEIGERELLRTEPRFVLRPAWASALPVLAAGLIPDDHPYGGLEVDRASNLGSIDLQAARLWAADRYVAKDTTIAIVGDVSLEDVTHLIFGNIAPELLHPDLTLDNVRRYPKASVSDPDPENPDHYTLWAQDPAHPEQPLSLEAPVVSRAATPADPPPPSDRVFRTARALVARPTVAVGWTVPAPNPQTLPLLRLTARAIARQMSLYSRDDPDVVHSETYGDPVLGCEVVSGYLLGFVICTLETDNPKNAERLAARAIDQVSSLWNPDLVLQIDMAFSFGVNSELTSLLHSLDKVADNRGGRSVLTAEHAHHHGSTAYHSELINGFARVNSEQAGDFAYAWLTRDRAVAALIEPLEPGQALGWIPEAVYSGNLLGGSGDPWPIAEGAVAATWATPRVEKIVEKTLSNGLHVVVMPHGNTPLVRAQLVTTGGRGTQPLGMDNFANANQSLAWSTYDGIKDPMRVAGRWDRQRTAQYTVEAVKTSAGNVPGALWLLRDLAESRAADMGGRSGWLKAQRTSMVADWDRAGWWATREKWARVLPDHPLAWEAGPADLEALKSMGSKEVGAYLKGKFKPGNTTLVIVGRVDPGEAMAEAETFFASWNSEGAAPTAVPGPTAPTSGGVLLFDQPGDRVQVQLTCQLPRWDEGANYASQSVLGRLASAAVTDLPEGTDFTVALGTTAQVQHLVGGTSLFNAATVVSPDKAGWAVNHLRGVLRHLADPVDLDPMRVDVERLRLAQGTATSFSSIDQMSDLLIRQVLANESSGRKWTWFEEYGAQVDALTPADVATSVGDCASNAVVTVLGPSEDALEGLAAEDVAFEVVDWRARRETAWMTWDPKGWEKRKKKMH